MTRRQKEISRQYMMWGSFIAVVLAMFGSMWLIFLGKEISGLSVITGSFFVALMGANGANLFSAPSKGADDVD